MIIVMIIDAHFRKSAMLSFNIINLNEEMVFSVFVLQSDQIFCSSTEDDLNEEIIPSIIEMLKHTNQGP